MSDFDVDGMIEGVRAQLAAQGVDLEGLSLDDLRDAISHPEAPKNILEIMGREPSSVKPGDPAPDFALGYLPGSGAGEMRLSEHFGRRPVALIFGSYT